MDKIVRAFDINKEADFFYFRCFAFYDEDPDKKLYLFKINYPPQLSFKRLMQGNFLKLSQVALKKKVLECIRFDTTLRMSGDWNLWLELVRNGKKGFFLNEHLIYCCMRDSGQSASARGKLAAKKEAALILKRWRRFLSFRERVSVSRDILKIRAKMSFNFLEMIVFGNLVKRKNPYYTMKLKSVLTPTDRRLL